MTKIIEGKLDARGIKIGIIVSRFNNFITEKLLDGALEGMTILPSFAFPVHSKYLCWPSGWRPAKNMMRWFA
jgi:hypothetical protein